MEQKSIAAQIVEAIDTENSKKIVKLFKDNPDQIKIFTPFGAQTWLGYTALSGKLNSLIVLSDLGIDINLGDKRDNSRPISSAAENGHIDVVEYLLKKGAELDVSSSIRNPLFAAIVGRSPSIVRLLLKADIDSEVRYNSPTMKNMDAVAFALMRGEQKIARIIALYNANGDNEKASVALAKANIIAVENS